MKSIGTKAKEQQFLTLSFTKKIYKKPSCIASSEYFANLYTNKGQNENCCM